MCAHVTVCISADVFASTHGCDGCVFAWVCLCVLCMCMYYSWSRLSPQQDCCCLLTSSIQNISKSLQLLLIENCYYILYYIAKVTPNLYLDKESSIYCGIFYVGLKVERQKGVLVQSANDLKDVNWRVAGNTPTTLTIPAKVPLNC